MTNEAWAESFYAWLILEECESPVRAMAIVGYFINQEPNLIGQPFFDLLEEYQEREFDYFKYRGH